MTALAVLGGLALVAFGPAAAVGFPVAAAVLDGRLGAPTGTAAGYVGLVLLYVWACWRWPQVDCWRCHGKPRKPAPRGLRGLFGRPFRVGCLACGGAGRYTRLGRRFTSWLNGR